MKSLSIFIFLSFISSCSNTTNMPRNNTAVHQNPTLDTASVKPNETGREEIVPASDIVRNIEQQKSTSMATRSLGSNSFVGTKNSGGLSLQAIQFEHDSSKLTESGIEQIGELANAIKQYKDDTFEIIGHTDATGSDEYNLSLSQRRAVAVINELKSKHGINTSRLQSIGKGEMDLADKSNPNSAKNRRVEILYINN